MVQCPSVLGVSPEERLRRYRRALWMERLEAVVMPLKRVLPQIGGDIMALIMSAGLFIVIAVTLCLI